MTIIRVIVVSIPCHPIWTSKWCCHLFGPPSLQLKPSWPTDWPNARSHLTWARLTCCQLITRYFFRQFSIDFSNSSMSNRIISLSWSHYANSHWQNRIILECEILTPFSYLTPNRPLVQTSFTYPKLNMDGFSPLSASLGYEDSSQEVEWNSLHAQRLVT